MNKKIIFTDETKDEIIDEQKVLGFRLYEEQKHFDGWWLLFTDEPYIEPPSIEPPHSTHISVLTAVNPTQVKPARVKRIWQGTDYFYDCFVSQTVKDEYMAGNIAIGDYVIVHYDDTGKQIVLAKVFKSW